MPDAPVDIVASPLEGAERRLKERHQDQDVVPPLILDEEWAKRFRNVEPIDRIGCDEQDELGLTIFKPYASRDTLRCLLTDAIIFEGADKIEL